MKLELKHLAPYLPYGLKIFNGWGDVKTLNYTHLDDENNGFITMVKPILRPLSDLNKSVFYEKYNENRVLMEDHIIFKRLSKKDFLSGKLEAYYHLTLLENYEIITYLFELHFDVLGLIEKGLAIDTNTLNPHP